MTDANRPSFVSSHFELYAYPQTPLNSAMRAQKDVRQPPKLYPGTRTYGSFGDVNQILIAVQMSMRGAYPLLLHPNKFVFES